MEKDSIEKYKEIWKPFPYNLEEYGFTLFKNQEDAKKYLGEKRYNELREDILENIKHAEQEMKRKAWRWLNEEDDAENV